MKKSISEIKETLLNTKTESEKIKELRQDQRKGVQQLLQSWDRKMEFQKRQEEEWERMLSYERALKNKGKFQIAGIDEVGRGPLAGPVTAAAVILPDNFYAPGLNDSKKLSEVNRNKYYSLITAEAAVGIGEASAEEIDEINIYEATKLAMLRAIDSLGQQCDALLIDAMTLPVETEQISIIKGDANSISIAAASIVAKVHRDTYMKKLHEQYPEYGFRANAGYGTKEHLTGLKKHGPIKEHRKSFAPVKIYLEE
ncbi:ribonuclease HII [Alkalicoccus daliensis]|uniref:Ribonuclease HII n=1 Tax=Alkalicoccus daliensis TaxID=745820 RepID=A0A1H0A2J3_9BACI|nr:ribonuclease HII [Alkalicoccus daliensis]SDN27431.1 RNase HII [Alkalicoccus daliensis]